MVDSSPSDLAVAFRSLPRRIAEARGEAPPEMTNSVLAEIDGLVADAARVVHAPADPAAVAGAIEAVHASQWSDADLGALRHIALDLGRLVRHLAALAETDGD